MSHVRSVTAADFAGDCPVSPALLARLIHADAGAARALVESISEVARAQLAVWLYGRSHTHELGVRIAATCSAVSLERAAGGLGRVLHDLSRRPYVAPSHGVVRPNAKRISLGSCSLALTSAA